MMEQWREQITQAEQQTGLPAGLLYSVIKNESRGRPDAVSPKGAQGLGQTMPATAADPGYGVTPFDPTNPAEAIPSSAKYLKAMLDKYGGDMRLALAAYNWGPGNVDRRSEGGERMPDETRNYIRKVMGDFHKVGGGETITVAAAGGDSFDAALGTQPRPAQAAAGGEVAVTSGEDPFAKAVPGSRQWEDRYGGTPQSDMKMPPAGEPSLKRVLGRIGMEGLGGTAGAAVGSRLAGPWGAAPGAAVGTYIGSKLSSNSFDPVENPEGEARTSALISGVMTPVGEKLVHLFSPNRLYKAGGQAAAQFFQSKGVTPPPGSVLKSELVQDIQNIAEGAFGVGGRITAMREAAEGVTEKEIGNYAKQFAAAEARAKAAFQQVDAAAPGLRVDLSALPQILDKIEAERLLTGMPEQVKSIFKNIRNNQAVTFEQAQQLRTTLLNMGRLMDDVDPEAAKVIARRIEPYVDRAMAQAGAGQQAGNRAFNDVLKEANEAWLAHKQGLAMNELILGASNAGNISGKQLLNRLDKSSLAERLSGPQMAEMRRLASALMVAEDKTGSGAFKFIGRQAQFVGALGLLSGQAPISGTVALVGPAALAWIMSNPKIAQLLITGVRSGPGTETGIRALTQLTGVLQRQGFLPYERVGQEGGEAPPATTEPGYGVPPGGGGGQGASFVRG